MIENKIVKDNNLSVNQEELFEFSKEYIVEQYMRYGVQLTEEMFEKAIKELFSNEKEIKNIRDILFVKKMTELFKSKFTLQIEEVDYDDFFNVKN